MVFRGLPQLGIFLFFALFALRESRQDGSGRDPGAGPLCRLLLEPGGALEACSRGCSERPRSPALRELCCKRAVGKGGCDAGAAAQASSVSKARRVVLAGAVLLALGALAAVAIIGGEAVKTGQVRMELSDRNEFEGAQSVWYCVCRLLLCVRAACSSLAACSIPSVRRLPTVWCEGAVSAGGFGGQREPAPTLDS